MKNLWRFIFRHHFLILFIIIEAFSLSLLINFNAYQKATFYGLSQKASFRVLSTLENIGDYLSLHYENKLLVEENRDLLNRLSDISTPYFSDSLHNYDNSFPAYYTYIPAKVINNSVNRQYNFLTIDKGKNDSIEPDMAVISSEGIVGITKSVSDNFTAILSLLNRNFTASGKIKKNGYFGPVNWQGNNTEIATMVDIPHHVFIEKGDTIVTSGFGEIFPENCLIGVIEDFRLKGGNYYEIDIKLTADLRKIHHVWVIKNNYKNELDSLLIEAEK